MKRLALGLLVILASLSVATSSMAQEPETAAPEPAGGDKTEPADTGPAFTPDLDLSEIPGSEELGTPGTGEDGKKAGDVVGARRKSWEDIVVVPRKAFLKKSRLEIAPFAGITLNDPLIRHYSFGGDINYYITDVLSVGVEGQYFIKELSERESLVGLQYYLVPTLNKLKYHYALAFGYVPGYGKFGLFNKWIVHWDLTFALGIGMIRTEIIPRAFGDKSFTNDNIVGHAGLGVRLFVLDWLTLGITFRDYVYQDAFEFKDRANLLDADGRPDNQNLPRVKQLSQQSQSQLVQNIMMMFSIGLYIPPSFTYRTPR
jgi:outer membrane beta-barrel protein